MAKLILKDKTIIEFATVRAAVQHHIDTKQTDESIVKVKSTRKQYRVSPNGQVWASDYSNPGPEFNWDAN